MDRREIKLPSKRHNETIDSWKKMLLECDQKDHSILESLLLPGDVNKCLQLLDHPARPNLEDLVPVLCQDVSSGPSTSSPVTVLSSGDVRSILQKRRREKSHARHQVKHPHLGRSESVESKVILGEDFEVGKDSLLDGNTTGGDSRLEGQVLDLPMMGPTDLLLPVNRITGDSASIGKESCSQEQEQLEELNQVVSLLCPKLEIIQPAGCRPSDIASQMDSDKISTPNADGADSGEQDRAFSQTGLSQQQIYLWDDLRLIIELASMSSSDKVAQETSKAVVSLGVQNLEDGVLFRLCTNEIFLTNEETEATSSTGIESEVPPRENTYRETDLVFGEESRTKLFGLSYPASLFLYRTLFLQKALQLRSNPSRLFLDALLTASRAHGRAMVDGVLLPLTRDPLNCSKFASELVQKISKEMSSASMTHFISQMLEPSTTEQQDSWTGHTQESKIEREMDNTLQKIPVVYLTGANLSVLQTALGYGNVPNPLPSRIWSQFVHSLEVLWNQLYSLASTWPNESQTLRESTHPRGQELDILKQYSPESVLGPTSDTSKSVGNDGGGHTQTLDQGAFRLSNQRLIQLLMMWVIRQGPMCQDTENIERLKTFCATRLEARLSKGLVSKLESLLKKKKR